MSIKAKIFNYSKNNQIESLTDMQMLVVWSTKATENVQIKKTCIKKFSGEISLQFQSLRVNDFLIFINFDNDSLWWHKRIGSNE